jgi:hypothetical protein
LWGHRDKRQRTIEVSGNISNWQDRYNHGMNKAVPFYNKYGSTFNWNKPGDGRIDTALDPDKPRVVEVWRTEILDSDEVDNIFWFAGFNLQ